jgi:hypothetical protein
MQHGYLARPSKHRSNTLILQSLDRVRPTHRIRLKCYNRRSTTTRHKLFRDTNLQHNGRGYLAVGGHGFFVEGEREAHRTARHVEGALVTVRCDGSSDHFTGS